MRKYIVSALYRISSVAPKFFLRKIVFLCFVLMELAWYLLGRIDHMRMLRYRDETIDFVCANIGSGERVLEIGPAEGYLSRKMIGKAGSLFGVEIDKRYYKDLKAIGDRRMRFVNDDIRTFPLEETFDAAVLVHVLEHIASPEELLRKLSLHAKKLIIESPSEMDWWLERLRKDLKIPAWGDEHHAFSFNGQELKKILEECGWRVVSIQEPVMLVRVVAASNKLS
ncbi:MAG: class I SAM-dependent methyltransferase [Candidatus Omnitrophota bacterium]